MCGHTRPSLAFSLTCSAFFEDGREFLYRSTFCGNDSDRLLARRANDGHLGVEELSAQQDVKSIGRDGTANGAVERIDLVLPAPGYFARGDFELRRPVELIARALAPQILPEARAILAREVGDNASESFTRT